jgi:CheY-like chemotaxis protein
MTRKRLSWWKRTFCCISAEDEDNRIEKVNLSSSISPPPPPPPAENELLSDQYDEEEEILPDDDYIRILIAEDNKITLDIMKRMLSQRSNIIVETVTDGERALELVTNTHSKNRYSLIVLDVHLVSMDGDAVVKGIRRRNIDVPILIVTADEKLAARCKRIGANEVMIKPLKRGSFLAVIDELICPSEMNTVVGSDV